MRPVSSSRCPRAPRSGCLLLAATLLALTAPGVLGPGRAAADEPPGAADRAARWLASQVTAGTVTTGGVPDPGLAADVALALTAVGRQDASADALARGLLERPTAYTAPSGSGQVVAGATAKLALLAGARALDPTDIAGVDLIADLRSTMVEAAGAADDGRFRDRPPTAVPTLADRSNTFTQAFGVLALTRRGPAPVAAIDHLLAQQCPGGAFRLFLTGGRGCTTDAAADVDATALAVMALDAVPAGVSTAAPPAVDRALGALEARQGADGSFTSSGPGATANANSTGLAAHALRIGGRTGAADRAAAWLQTLQLGCSPVAGDDGAVAFSPGALAAAAGGVPSTGRDQFRRATSQAILAFDAAPLGTAGPAVANATGCLTTPTSTSTTTTSVPPGGATSTTLPPTSLPPTGPPPTSLPAPTTTASAGTPAAVLGATETSGNGAGRSTTGSGTSSARALALTGRGPSTVAAAALWFVVGGSLLLIATRRRRP